MRWFWSIFFVLHLLNSYCCAQVNAYIIDKVPVDVTAKDSTVARGQAVLMGQKTALGNVLSSLGEAPAKVQQLSDNQLNDMLVGYEIYDERTSTNRYRAHITFHFDEEAIQQWLQKSSNVKSPTSLKTIAASTHDPFDDVLATIHAPLDSSTRHIESTISSTVRVQFSTFEQWTAVLKNLRHAAGIQQINIDQFTPKSGNVSITLASPEVILIDIIHQVLTLIENKHELWRGKVESLDNNFVIDIK